MAPPPALVDLFRKGWESWEEPPQLEEKPGAACKRRKAAADVTMDLAVLDCPVCCHPLRSPIFQCTVGHTICSSCHDKLPEKCHFCSLPTVYSRCHMVENVVESIKVACSNVNHGCTARITYYQKEEHEKGCPHAPCFCPETGCSFSGSTARLLEHFLGKHKWHSPKVTYNKAFQTRIHLGSTVLVGEDGHVFLVNMTMEALGPSAVSSQFAASSLTLLDPNSSAGWHCPALNQATLRLWSS